MLEVKQLCKSFGGIDVIKNASLSLEAGERRVILGPNGAGKTTLFNLLTGTLQADAGDILLDKQSIIKQSATSRARNGLARSYQKNNLFENLTMRENLALAASTAQGKANLLWRDNLRDKDVQRKISEIAQQIGLTDLLDCMVGNASYGNRRQLEIGIALATQPRLLLMDEPTSGVDPSMIEGFHLLLQQLPKHLTIIIIEHDMDIAFKVADRITVLNFGEVIFEGTPKQVKNNQMVRDIYLGDI